MSRFRLAAVLLAVLATAACGSGGELTGPGPGTQHPGTGSTNPLAALAGTYRLATVNGNPLTMPWETDGAFANYFDSGEIVLHADGTFERTIRGRTVIPQMNDIVHNEAWSGTYTFEPSAAGEDNGRITLLSGSELTGFDEDELDITQISITDVNDIPVTSGTQQFIFVYVRD